MLSNQENGDYFLFVYKITNLINKKIYIGQTIRTVEARFRRHISDAINNTIDTHLARAIRKYGEENFSIEIIDSAESQEELTQKEHFWIVYYNSVDSNVGYNETSAITKCGGNTYGSKTDEELGIIKEKLSISKTGQNNPMAASVKCLNVKTGEELIFNTVKECQDYFKEKTHRFVTTRTNHNVKSLYKEEWAIAYVDDDYLYETNPHKRGVKTRVLDVESGEEREFESIRLMCREMNINRNIITKSIRNNQTKIEIDNYEITIIG